MSNDFDSVNIYFKKDDVLIGIHAIGIFGPYQYKLIHLDGIEEDKFSLFMTMEVWGNEYDADMNILGRGSFRVHETDVEEIVKDYKNEGWSLLSEKEHYDLNKKFQYKNSLQPDKNKVD